MSDLSSNQATQNDPIIEHPPEYSHHYKTKPPMYSEDSPADRAKSTESGASVASTASSSGRKSKRAGKPPPPLRPTDPHADDNEYLASLRTWAREKEYLADDHFGGHKGASTGDAHDPLQGFRWIGRKIRGKPTNGGKKHEADDDTPPTPPDAITDGDVDTHQIV
jgi:hypothetical protein